MATVIVNGTEIEIGEDERLNGIQVARRAGVDVPHYCWHPGLSVVASCRMCLVETGRRDPATGEISMMPKVVPGCQTPATDNTVFVTDSDKVKAARAMVEEDLLIRHPIDCPICDKAGECALQDYHFKHGREERRADLKPFTSRRRPMGDTVTLFVDRCVMCTRCVRFTREITGTAELMVINRGSHEEIDVFPGYPLDNKMSGNVVDLCPVGALGDKDFLYSQRVWFMKSHDGVCAGCSTGCSIKIEENQDRIYRLKPRENRHVNQWWMCDEGRYGFKYVHNAERQIQPTVSTADGATPVEWPEAQSHLQNLLKNSPKLAVVVSPFLTVEEAFMLCKLAKQADPDAILALGPVPQSGQDESFANGFTIRAEKCPNRRGVEKVIGHFAGQTTSFEDFVTDTDCSSLDAVWVTGGYPQDWMTTDQATKLSAAGQLIVQDIFTSPVWEVASVRLPGVAFAEREGSYVNANDRLQSFEWAIRPPAGAMMEGRLYWNLLGEMGMYDAQRIRQMVAREIAFFAPAAGEIPAEGVDLRINQIAQTQSEVTA
ncbi:MAG: 2Fe-2S iron-sulfur cluster-binding protein [Pirellulaceae bacterium]